VECIGGNVAMVKIVTRQIGLNGIVFSLVPVTHVINFFSFPEVFEVITIRSCSYW